MFGLVMNTSAFSLYMSAFRKVQYETNALIMNMGGSDIHSMYI